MGGHAQKVTMVEYILFKRKLFPIERKRNRSCGEGAEKGKSSLETRKIKQECLI